MMNLSLIRKQARHSHTSSPTITHSTASQAGELARLASLSRANAGWIVIANTPGRLCRHALAAAGLDPARVIDAHQLSAAQLQRALASPAIAAVVCWQEQDGAFLRNRQASGRLFVIGPAVPASRLH